MKKILALILLFSSLSAHSADGKITGETQVCPGKNYIYTFTLAQPATVSNLPISVYVPGGKHYNETSDMKTFYMQIGQKSLSFTIVWNDKGGSGNFISIGSNEGNGKLDIAIASFKGTKASDFNNYGFKSTPDVSNDVFKIPYGQSGTLKMSVSNIYYPLCSIEDYLVKTFIWTIGQTSIETTNSYSLDYNTTNLDGTIISVAPIGKACGTTSTGGAVSYKIERYIDFSLSNNVNSYICNNNNVVFTLNGNIPSGSTIAWSIVKGFTLVNNNGTTATFKASGSGFGSIKATVTYQGKVFTIENFVWIGGAIASRPPYIEEDAFILPNNTNMVEVSSYIQGAQNYNWTFVKGRDKCVRFDGFQNADRNFFWPAKPTGSDIYNEYIFDVEGVNSCGKVTNRIRFIYPKYANGGFSLRSASLEEKNQPEIKSVKIYNLSGVLVYSNNAVNGSFDIKSTVLTDGIYIIEKFDGQNRTSEKVMLKR